MAQNLANYFRQARAHPRKVWFTGSTALLKGVGLCYDMDYTSSEDGEAATDGFQGRGGWVALPTQSTNNHFAGVTSRAYPAQTNGQIVEIYEPGSICQVAVGVNTVVGETILTCSASAGDPGRFTQPGFIGRGTALALETNASAILSTLDDGTTIMDSSTPTIPTLTIGIDFIANSVTINDTVIIVAGEDNDTNAIIPGPYSVASVTSDTALIITDDGVGARPSDGGSDLKFIYYIIRGNPTVLAYLYDGEESGLQETLAPSSPGEASADTFIVMSGGKTRFAGGYTIATNNARESLADGLYLGQKKSFECLGAIGTSNIEIEFDTAGKQNDDSALNQALFNAANEVLDLVFWTAWVEQYSAGSTLS